MNILYFNKMKRDVVSRIFQTENLLASLQWFFFIFANIVIIPITVGEAFELNQAEVVSLVQMSFIVTGLACLAQAFFGHRRPILEGQSGLWWGIYLTLVATSDRKSTRLNSSHVAISYAVFCL